MLKLIIYAAVLALSGWAVWYVVRHLRRQMKGRCGCGCGGACDGCPAGGCAGRRKH